MLLFKTLSLSLSLSLDNITTTTTNWLFSLFPLVYFFSYATGIGVTCKYPKFRFQIDAIKKK